MTSFRIVNIAFRISVCCVVCAVVTGIARASEMLLPVDSSLAVVRRPADMVVLSDKDTLAIVNRLTGTLTFVDLLTRNVHGEYRLGKDLRGCAALPGMQLAAVDFASHELLIVACAEPPQVIQRLPVPRYPVDVQATLDGTCILVCSLWTHRVSLWKQDGSLNVYHSAESLDSGFPPGSALISPDGSFNVYHSAESLDSGFPPGSALISPDGSFAIVADAFDGELRAMDIQTGAVRGQHALRGHNIRGLAFFQERLLLSHQVLHAHVPTIADEIAAGTVIENLHRDIELLRSPAGGIEFRPRAQGELGTPSEGAADPAGIAISKSGERFVALSGTNEVALLNELGSVRGRPDVGQHPTAVLYDALRDQIVVLNEFSDSISIIHASRHRAIREIPLGIQAELTSAQRGEELFFDGRLGRFGWMSCHSCHPLGHQIQARADTFGDDSYGAPKRVVSLLGGRDNNPWAWNGKQRSLHEQVFKSLQTTMHGDRISARQINDMVAFLHTLDFPPPLQPVTSPLDAQRVELGRKVFHTQGCQRCHIPPLTYTSDGTFDVGLEDEQGQRKFNPPSLRGVSQRRGYFHDLRAHTLADIFVEHGHQLQNVLSDDDLSALLRFLCSL